MKDKLTGKFIVIEGLEGAGKTTAMQTVSQELNAKGIHTIFTREPGGTLLAEELRDIIKNHPKTEAINPKTELLLLYAARLQLVETVIKPALKRGIWVIGDRHDLSTQAYQGGGREIDLHLLNVLKKEILGDFSPDLTFYLDIPPELGLERARARGKLDRIEQSDLSFFTRAHQRYRELAAQDERIKTIDASQNLANVTADLQQTLEIWLGEQKL